MKLCTIFLILFCGCVKVEYTTEEYCEIPFDGVIQSKGEGRVYIKKGDLIYKFSEPSKIDFEQLLKEEHSINKEIMYRSTAP